jgi:hypothetical protein
VENINQWFKCSNSIFYDCCQPFVACSEIQQISRQKLKQFRLGEEIKLKDYCLRDLSRRSWMEQPWKMLNKLFALSVAGTFFP